MRDEKTLAYNAAFSTVQHIAGATMRSGNWIYADADGALIACDKLN